MLRTASSIHEQSKKKGKKMPKRTAAIIKAHAGNPGQRLRPVMRQRFAGMFRAKQCANTATPSGVNKIGREEVKALVVAAGRKTMPEAQTMTTTVDRARAGPTGDHQ
jgi:hypothetical protein